MGCWNKTCGLSNLHITAGDEVYVFVLEKNEHHDRCYSTAFWKPLLMPFESVYDDYGGGEDNKGPWLPYILEGLRDRLVEVELGENQCHDIAVKRDAFDEDLFFEAVHEGRLFLKGHPTPSEVDFVMIRKDVMDGILDSWTIEKYVGDGKGTCGWDNNYIKYQFKDILAALPEYLDRFESKLKDDDDTETGIFRRMKFYGRLDDLFGYDENLVASWLGGDNNYRYCRVVRENEFLIDLMADGKRTEVEALLTEYLKGKFIDGFMHNVRKCWAPGGHEGSQTSDRAPYRTLISVITKTLDAEKARHEADNGEEYEN